MVHTDTGEKILSISVFPYQTINFTYIVKQIPMIEKNEL